ncbi:MAG: hypothetical protein Rubg2KO_29190 [Rubricoccaceae bacterium]
MWRGLLLVGLVVSFASSSHAQAFGSCETGTAHRFIETPVLRAAVMNTGGLFFGGATTSGEGYIIPKGEETPLGRPVSPIFAAGLWLGGRVDGELRVAAARYGGWDFWPGPLEDATRPPQDCSAYDRIFVVSREDVARFLTTGELTEDLRDWPHQLGAPVRDGDGDPTNYDLRAGDQPELIGDMAAWWVMNDAGNDHNPGPPLGVEVRMLAFAFGGAGIPQSPALTQTTFYRYEILNRGRQPVDSMYAAMWGHFDLGDTLDDYIGVDTLLNLQYVYNVSNEDEAYGEAPPAFGVQVLSGPVGLANGRDEDFDGTVDEPGERLQATATGPFFYECGLCDFFEPGYPEEFYSLMQGQWQNGEPIIAFGDGFYEYGRPEPITPFLFSGDPVTESFWSEMNTDGTGQRNGYQGYRRGSLATGPFRLEPGARATLLYAMPYARSTSHLQSVAALRAIASALQNASSVGAFEQSAPVRAGEHGGLDGQDRPVTLSRVHPNPVSGSGTAFLTLPTETHVRATVMDALGRQLEVLEDGVLPEGETELVIPDGLAPGTYLLRVEVAPGAVETLTFTVAR